MNIDWRGGAFGMLSFGNIGRNEYQLIGTFKAIYEIKSFIIFFNAFNSNNN